MKRKHKRMLIRLAVALLLTVFAVLIPIDLPFPVELIIYLVAYFVIGYDVLWRSARNIARGQVFDENFLMTVATLGAFLLGEYLEAVGVMVFYQTGELFSAIAVGNSRRSISALMSIRPDTARRIDGDKEEIVSPECIAIGEIIEVRAGERIALDGVIVDGKSSLDLSALTGESLPKDVGAGDRVYSGAVNLFGVIKIRVESVFSESTASKILELVENSAAKKARSERFITRFARYYTPCVVLAALLLAIVPSVIFGNVSEWIRRGLVFLMVSCPCALVISIPLSFFGGIGGASREGILIKGATNIESLSKVDTVVFDKTGTLTEGGFSVIGIKAKKMSEAELLEIAAHLECESNHPIARSIFRAYGKDIDRSRIVNVRERLGFGVEAELDGKTYYAGNMRYMCELGIEAESEADYQSAIHISSENEYLGCIVLSDSIKDGSKKAIESLKSLGIKHTVMLTGDMKITADIVANSLGIDEVCSELLPSQKVDAVEELIAKGRKVAFVGDGINDAPVISRADVGIAMGAIGSDAAIEAADIVLMDDDPKKIAVAISRAKKTMRIVRQNIVFALFVKGIILILGALGYVGMWLAIFGDVGVMIIAILNSMRTLKNKSR